jgi:hypothetical protein
LEDIRGRDLYKSSQYPRRGERLYVGLTVVAKAGWIQNPWPIYASYLDRAVYNLVVLRGWYWIYDSVQWVWTVVERLATSEDMTGVGKLPREGTSMSEERRASLSISTNH